MSRGVWRRRLAGAGAGALLLGSTALAAETTPPAPYEPSVKAAFLYHFARFVEWPEPPAEIVIGLLGADPFGPLLDQEVAGKSVGGRALVVRRLDSAEAGRRCAIVFIALDGDALTRALEALKGAPVLTVGDNAEFIHRGGMIGFVRVENHVSLEIDADKAEAARLRISSRLLSLSTMARRSILSGAKR
jgi:hypothetical protein